MGIVSRDDNKSQVSRLTSLFSSDEGMDRTIRPEPSAPEKFHRGYYKANIGRLKANYKKQGIELPDYFSSSDNYVEYMVGKREGKMYGGRVQPRRASNAGDNE